MLEITPNDPLIKAYLRDIERLRSAEITYELGLKGPFQNLLDKAAKKRGWMLVPELSTYSGGKRVVPDGTIRDEFRLARGWWEAKDTDDDLAAEIGKKLKAGYPTRNTIFEDTQTAVLFQDRAEAGAFSLSFATSVADLLNRFFAYEEADEREFLRAMDDFKLRIPDLAESLREHIAEAHNKVKPFKQEFKAFVELCRASLNPELTEAQIDEMLIQHLLTERLMRNLFQNPEFTQRNVIASQVERVISALAAGSFNRAQFLQRLDPYYRAIERAGANLNHFLEKQEFLNSVYEQFFQKFSPNIADTHGIVYTPREIVDYMCRAVDQALKDEFDKSLSSPDVLILDPCTGTRNFVVNILERLPGSALRQAYEERLFANEVMLLPYYVASLNIEHAYYERMGEYRSFEGLCFVDTLDMAEAQQMGFFTAANSARVERERGAALTVVIGNPPYNVGQKRENDNNQNRKYPILDARLRDTYSKASNATSRSKLNDPYVKFFRWATDRLGKRNGIVCFVSNNGFVDRIAFDGMRKLLMRDFDVIYHLDLHGDVRDNPKLSGTTHNVFGIQVGVGITIAIRRRGAAKKLRYHRVPEFWTKRQKLEFVLAGEVPWLDLSPQEDGTWLIAENSDEFKQLVGFEEIFSDWTLGVGTNRDAVVYGWQPEILAQRVAKFIDEYNLEAQRHVLRPDSPWSDKVKWSETLKKAALRGRMLKYDPTRIVQSLWRPFTKKWLYFDRIINERVYRWPSIEGRFIVTSDIGWRSPDFNTMMSDVIVEKHLCATSDAHQCFAESAITDKGVDEFRSAYKDPSIHRSAVFNYLYAVLHHPDYRRKFSGNLKQSLSRVPFIQDFWRISAIGRKLGELHVGYESVQPWPLKFEEDRGRHYSEQVDRLSLSADRTSIRINSALTLSGIPEKAFQYRLGGRSPLEWIIDQYKVVGDENPNREDDPGYIIKLIGQVVTVSIETVRLVEELSSVPFDQVSPSKAGTR